MSKLSVKEGRILARSASEAKRYVVIKKALISLLIALVILTTLTYIVSVLYSKFGSFTVGVNKYDVNKYSLTLSESPNFSVQTSRLNAKAAEDITNISVDSLPKDLDKINGEHNGKDYLAYTFYLKNVGEDTVTYQYSMGIANVQNNVDKAIRIRLFVDGVPVTYARTRSDGGGAEQGTTEFVSNRTIVRNQIKDFKPDDVTKFTVVIWVEGDDPDCVDELIGGSLKTDMDISVINSSDIEAKSDTKNF